MMKKVISLDSLQLRIMIYQYLMFKGDFYNQKRKQSFDKIKCCKTPSLSDLETFYRDSIMWDCFQRIESDIIGLIDMSKFSP